MSEGAAAPPSPAGAARDLGELVQMVFARWQAAEIEFLVLRNYEKLPQETGNDIDVLVAPRQLPQAERVLIEAARATGYRWHNRAEFSPVSLFFYQPESGQQIQFDLFSNLVWRGFELMPAAEVLARRQARGNFFIPGPADEAILNLLTRLLYQGVVKEKYRPAIAARLAGETGRMRERLARVFGARQAAQIITLAGAGDWDAVERCGGALRRRLIWRQLMFAPGKTVYRWVSDLCRLMRRFGRLPGLTVVLVGADGCGKSTLADGLVTALAGTFHENKSRRIHWKPAVFLRRRRAERRPTINPHGQPARGKFLSALLLIYHWAEFFAGYWLQLRPALFRNGMVLIDRYHYDFVVDPRRFRLAALPCLARGLFRLLPAPDLIFVLDAPPEVLQARKQEVPLVETARQCEAYRSEVGRLPNARVIDVTQPVETIAATVTQAILTYMAARQTTRYGQPPNQ